MAKLRIFAVGADLKRDKPVHFLAVRLRHHVEVRVSRNELRQIDDHTFQEVQTKSKIEKRDSRVGYDGAVGVREHNGFREAWSLKPSGGRVYVWQLKTRRK